MDKEILFTQQDLDAARDCGFWHGVSRSCDCATGCVIVTWLLYALAGRLGQLSVAWF